jgi:hypothetical protein
MFSEVRIHNSSYLLKIKRKEKVKISMEIEFMCGIADYILLIISRSRGSPAAPIIIPFLTYGCP